MLNARSASGSVYRARTIAHDFMEALQQAFGKSSRTESAASQQPHWLLGQIYQPDDVEELQKDFSSRLWMTYKREFDAIGDSKLNSDAGWGCMLRSGQMMLAQALVVHFMNREWRYDISRRRPLIYSQIIRWFLDIPDRIICPFSLHCLLGAGYNCGKSAGEWFGPHETCVLIKRCIDQHLASNLCCVLCQNGGIFANELLKASNEPQNGNWKSLIVLVSLRLGLSQINEIYIPDLMETLKWPQSIGIIGGKPKSSLYFVGCRGSEFLYLDPHTVQGATSLNHDYSENSEMFHCSEMRWISAKQIDPCLCIGFYIESSNSWEDFWSRVTRLSHSDYPIFNVAKESPDFQSLADYCSFEELQDDGADANGDFVIL